MFPIPPALSQTLDNHSRGGSIIALSASTAIEAQLSSTHNALSSALSLSHPPVADGGAVEASAVPALPTEFRLPPNQMGSDTAPAEYQSQSPSPIISPKGSITSAAMLQMDSKQSDSLLTMDEKRANHIASEQKRRQNLRGAYERVIELVPELNSTVKSEAAILEKTANFIEALHIRRTKLDERIAVLKAQLDE